MSNDLQQRIETLELALEQERSVRLAAEARGRRWAVRATVGVGVLAAVAVLGRVGIAYAACTPALPSPLVAFCDGQPAKAVSVNTNFLTLANAIINKTGGLTSSDATMTKAVTSSIVANGAGPVVVGSDLSVPNNVTLGAAGKTTTINGAIDLLGLNVPLTVGATNTAPSDGFILVSFDNSTNCVPTTAQMLMGGTGGPVRAQATAASCGGSSTSGKNSLFAPVRKGEVYVVAFTNTSYSLASAGFVPFGN